MVRLHRRFRPPASLILAAVASGCGSGSEPSDEPELHDLLVFEALGKIGTMAADGSQRQILPTGDDLEFADTPMVSPDGRRVLFSGLRDGQWDLYVMNVDGSARRQLTDDPAQDLSPSWHPGGDSLVFTWSPSDTRGGLVVMAADGTGRRQLVEWGAGGRWSPDGRHVMFYGFGDRVPGIYLIGPEGGEESRLDRECEYDCTDSGVRWSPDGQYITFVRYGSDVTPRLGIMRDDGSDPRLLFPTIYTFGGIWSPDGTQLAMNRWSDEEEAYSTYIVTVATGDTVRIASNFEFVSDWPR